eukprot:scaffold13626_cov110-Isochrysis_galbana.AAC.8
MQQETRDKDTPPQAGIFAVKHDRLRGVSQGAVAWHLALPCRQSAKLWLLCSSRSGAGVHIPVCSTLPPPNRPSSRRARQSGGTPHRGLFRA